MQNVIAKKSDEALQVGCERAKYSANVSGLEHARTGTDYAARALAASLELVALYEAEINARIAARIEANRAFDMNLQAMEDSYNREMARIEEVEAAKIEALEMQWEEMVLTGEAFEVYGWED